MLQQREFSISLTHPSKRKTGGCKTLQPRELSFSLRHPSKGMGEGSETLKPRELSFSLRHPSKKKGEAWQQNLTAKSLATTFTFLTCPLWLQIMSCVSIVGKSLNSYVTYLYLLLGRFIVEISAVSYYLVHFVSHFYLFTAMNHAHNYRPLNSTGLVASSQ